MIAPSGPYPPDWSCNILKSKPEDEAVSDPKSVDPSEDIFKLRVVQEKHNTQLSSPQSFSNNEKETGTKMALNSEIHSIGGYQGLWVHPKWMLF